MTPERDEFEEAIQDGAYEVNCRSHEGGIHMVCVDCVREAHRRALAKARAETWREAATLMRQAGVKKSEGVDTMLIHRAGAFSDAAECFEMRAAALDKEAKDGQ